MIFLIFFSNQMNEFTFQLDVPEGLRNFLGRRRVAQDIDFEALDPGTLDDAPSVDPEPGAPVHDSPVLHSHSARPGEYYILRFVCN